VPVFELHPEHGVGERLGDRSLDLDSVLLRQALPSVPRRRTGPIRPRTTRNRPRTEARSQYTGPPSARPSRGPSRWEDGQTRS
jgi:hypothetical protein